MNHTDCTHAPTKSARSKCRWERRIRDTVDAHLGVLNTVTCALEDTDERTEKDIATDVVRDLARRYDLGIVLPNPEAARFCPTCGRELMGKPSMCAEHGAPNICDCKP